MISTSTINEQFDIKDFFNRLFIYKETDIIEYTAKELHVLVNQATEIFKREPTLAKLSPPCTIVGDIHGQYRDLLRILNCQSGKGKTLNLNISALAQMKFMFLGDFVDRGPQSIECICMVFCLKVMFPNKYMLLRGNHETKSINLVYGFREELIAKLGSNDGAEVWEHFNDAFSWMPLAGLVGQKILCMHGGISPWLSTLNDILMIQRPLVDVNDNKLALDLLWSDPLDKENINAINDKPRYLKNALRGLSCTFNDQAIHECTKRLNLDLIVRAHQVQDNGFKFTADRKLLTIFSAPKYMNETDNKGAILKVYGHGQLSVVTLKGQKTDKVGKMDNGEPTRVTSVIEQVERKKEQKTQSQSSQSKSNNL